MSADDVDYAMTAIANEFGQVEELDTTTQFRRPTASARNIGEAAHLVDYLIMLTRRQDVDQRKLRMLIAGFIETAEAAMDEGRLRT